MSFVNAYRKVRSSVVAIVPKFYKERPSFPDIIGTGFIVSELGIVCTCRHVAESALALYKPRGYQGFPASVLLFVGEVQGREGVGVLNVDVEQVGAATLMGDAPKYLGPNPPDISFMLLSVTATPAVEFTGQALQEGEEVAFAGFPMGTRTLEAPGWLHQLSPTLQSGIVSAVLPYHADPMPHGFLLHANTQPGASGSPVFREDGRVVGMVYMVLRDWCNIGRGGNDAGYVVYSVPTSLTGCVPYGVIGQVLTHAEKGIPAKRRRTLREHVNSGEIIPLESGRSPFVEWRTGDG